jgi:tRNA A-37 threonylcarbamoyl transferase component Bud32
MTEGRASELVKPPQSRDGRGISAVYLEPAERWGLEPGQVYVKRQEEYYCRPAWRLFRRTPTLRRELRALTACHRLDIPVPEVVRYDEQGPNAELVIAEIADSQPLGDSLKERAAERHAILDRVAQTVARLHRAGWYHGALYPTHILVGRAPSLDVTLIDFEKARRSRYRRREDLDRLLRYLAPLLERAELVAFEQTYHDVLKNAPA